MWSTIFWFFRLGRLFFYSTPVGTFAVIVMTLVSQVAFLVSLILPLKIIMLLGSEGIPRYFPPQLFVFDKDHLVIGLSAFALISYLVHFTSSKVVSKVSDVNSNALLTQSKKIVIFENQYTIAANAYKKYAEALASFIFVMIALGVIGLLYIDVFLFFILVLFFTISCLIVFYSFRKRKLDKEGEWVNKALGTLSVAFFFLVFSYIVIDYLFYSPPVFLVALVTIILSRQVASRLVIVVKSILLLRNQQPKIDALYFHTHVFFPEVHVDKKNLWSFLETDEMHAWLPSLLNEVEEGGGGDFSARWIQAGVNNVLFIEVAAGVKNVKFLIKIFDLKRTSAAVHESTLLFDAEKDLPSLPLLLVTTIEGYHCHVFDFSEKELVSRDKAKVSLSDIRRKLIFISPSQELVERYRRSKPFIYDRVDSRMLERVKLVASDQELEEVVSFRRNWPLIKEIVRNLPHSISSVVGKELVATETLDDRPLLIHWAEWKIEPAGSGWPIFPGELDDLRDTVNDVKNLRFSEYPADHYVIAALLSAFELACLKQRYKDAIDIAGKINNSLLSLESNEGKAL